MLDRIFKYLENLPQYKKRKIKTYIQRILCIILLVLFLMVCVNLGSSETLLIILGCIAGIAGITLISFIFGTIIYILLNW